MPCVGLKRLCNCKPDGMLDGEPFMELDHYARYCGGSKQAQTTAVLSDVAEVLYQDRIRNMLGPRYESGCEWQYSNTQLTNCPATMYFMRKYDYIDHPLSNWWTMMGTTKHLFLHHLKEMPDRWLAEEKYVWEMDIDGDKVSFHTTLDLYDRFTRTLIDYKSKGDKEVLNFWPKVLGGWKKDMTFAQFLAEPVHEAWVSQLNVGAEFMRREAEASGLGEEMIPEHLYIRRITHSDAGPIWDDGGVRHTGIPIPMLAREQVQEYVKHNVRMLHSILKPGIEVDETSLPLNPPFNAKSFYSRQPQTILKRLQLVKGFSELVYSGKAA